MSLRLVFSLLVAAGFAAGAGAWDDEPTPRVEFGLHSRVLSRGVDFGGAGAFGVVEIHREHWALSVEHREPWRGAHARWSRASAEYRHSFASELSVALGASHRRHGGVSGWGWDHSSEIGATLRGAAQRGFTPSLAWTRDLRLRANIAEARLAHSFALTRWGAFLDWAAVAGWVEAADLRPDSAGPRRGDGYGYASLEGRLPYRVGESTMIILDGALAGTRGASPLWSPRGLGDGVRVAVSLSVTRDF